MVFRAFFKKYHQGVWWYRSTSYDWGFDPIEVQKDLGMTYATLPEHLHYEKTGKEEIQLDKCVNKAHELGMETLYIDRAFIHNRAWTKAGLEKARRRLKLIKEQYGNKISGIYICDEPWWGRSDENTLNSKNHPLLFTPLLASARALFALRAPLICER